MKTRPKSLTFLGIFLFAVAIGLPVQIMYLYENSVFEWSAVFAKLSPLNWLIVLSAPVVGRMVWRAHPYSRYAVPVFGMLVVYNNWFVAEVGTDYSRDVIMISTAIFVGSLATIMTKEAREILSHPERRWWLTPTRKKAELPIRVCFFKKKGKEATSSREFYSRTVDISQGGAFVNLDSDDLTLMTDDTLKNLKEGTNCYITITLKDLCYMQCRAEIVRRTEGKKGLYPAGIGLRFVGLGWSERKMLEDFMNKSVLKPVPIASAA